MIGATVRGATIFLFPTKSLDKNLMEILVVGHRMVEFQKTFKTYWNHLGSQDGRHGKVEFVSSLSWVWLRHLCTISRVLTRKGLGGTNGNTKSCTICLARRRLFQQSATICRDF